MNKLKVAVIGCGDVSGGHFLAWKKVKEANVVACCDLNIDFAKKAAGLWKVPNFYQSFSELLQKEDVDVVDILTPPQTHKTLAQQAMNAGSNVVIEKPMTMTTVDAEEIVESQKKTGMKAGVIHNWLFEPPIVEASSIVKRGQIGEVLGVEIEALSTKNDGMASSRNHWCHNAPGGRFSEMIAHPIYLIRHFLGQFESHYLSVGKIGEYPWMKSDELAIICKCGNKLARAYASFNAPRKAIFVSLYGKDAILKLDVINATLNVLPLKKANRFSKGFDSLRQAAQILKSTAINTEKIAFGSWLSGHEKYIQLFAESIINDTEVPVTVEEGYYVVKSVEEMAKEIEKAEIAK